MFRKAGYPRESGNFVGIWFHESYRWTPAVTQEVESVSYNCCSVWCFIYLTGELLEGQFLVFSQSKQTPEVLERGKVGSRCFAGNSARYLMFHRWKKRYLRLGDTPTSKNQGKGIVIVVFTV